MKKNLVLTSVFVLLCAAALSAQNSNASEIISQRIDDEVEKAVAALFADYTTTGINVTKIDVTMEGTNATSAFSWDLRNRIVGFTANHSGNIQANVVPEVASSPRAATQAPKIVNGEIIGKYKLMNDIVEVQLYFVIGSTTSKAAPKFRIPTKDLDDLGIVYSINVNAAQNVNVSDSEEYEVNKDGTLVKYHGTEAYVSIPDNLGITRIGDAAFANNTNLVTVTLSDRITIIGVEAFSGCSNLASITMQDSVTIIASRAFWKCSKLYIIRLSNRVTSIGDQAFQECSSLKIITLPISVESIGSWAFQECSSLESITILGNVKTIGYATFYKCSKLKSIMLPNSVISIGDHAFRECSSLESIWLPDNVTTIGNYAFHNCGNLTSITIPPSVTTIGDFAFAECSNLTSVERPPYAKYNPNAFPQSANITDTVLPSPPMIPRPPLLSVSPPVITIVPSYKIGDRGPAGGIVFYDQGESSDDWRYLEAAPMETQIFVPWGPLDENMPGTEPVIGSGKWNTGVIANYLRATGRDWEAVAVLYCDNFIFGGYDDWFLPSKDELNLMYQNLKQNRLGDFSDAYYWSSSQDSVTQSWSQNFSDGKQYVAPKSYTNAVRAIRSF